MKQTKDYNEFRFCSLTREFLLKNANEINYKTISGYDATIIISDVLRIHADVLDIEMKQTILKAFKEIQYFTIQNIDYES